MPAKKGGTRNNRGLFVSARCAKQTSSQGTDKEEGEKLVYRQNQRSGEIDGRRRTRSRSQGMGRRKV